MQAVVFFAKQLTLGVLNAFYRYKYRYLQECVSLDVSALPGLSLSCLRSSLPACLLTGVRCRATSLGLSPQLVPSRVELGFSMQPACVHLCFGGCTLPLTPFFCVPALVPVLPLSHFVSLSVLLCSMLVHPV